MYQDTTGSVLWFCTQLLKDGTEKLLLNFTRLALNCFEVSDKARLQSYDNLMTALKLILDKKVTAENVELILTIKDGQLEFQEKVTPR